jgi:hypothetical protein
MQIKQRNRNAPMFGSLKSEERMLDTILLSTADRSIGSGRRSEPSRRPEASPTACLCKQAA